MTGITMPFFIHWPYANEYSVTPSIEKFLSEGGNGAWYSSQPWLARYVSDSLGETCRVPAMKFFYDGALIFETEEDKLAFILKYS